MTADATGRAPEQWLESPHTFHIPVMGTGFTVDTPLRVARYGISSVISIGDDVLIEQMRKFHCENNSEKYEAIPSRSEDARARRITAYLDLVQRLVTRQIETLRRSPFGPGSEITRYFELLPEGALRRRYRDMLAMDEGLGRDRVQEELRTQVRPGRIDVNILTKADRNLYDGTRELAPEFAVAMSALRGYARSGLRSSVVFSAGMNPRLYRYAAEFDDFLPDADGALRKQIILKVSDFRSALVQGKFLAKRGLWVSEFRIESGLNCGGHAFATNGYLLGPILAEFAEKREELAGSLHEHYREVLSAEGRYVPTAPRTIRITVQGGIGTPEENEFLLRHYGADGTGWGTPFLLVPEVTNVDAGHLVKLAEAVERDVVLSPNSPFGIPFWILRTSAAEETRLQRIEEGRPGSPCPKGYLASDTAFTHIPICPASHAYQKRRLAQLATEGLPEEALSTVREQVLAKSCLCEILAGAAISKNGIDPGATAAICCGPGIVDYSRTMTLEEIVDHIYGRRPLDMPPDRPHMFIREIALYADFLENEIRMFGIALSHRSPASLHEFRNNLLQGITYYRRVIGSIADGVRERFAGELGRLEQRIGVLASPAWLERARPVAGKTS